jgi:hypothetical protein
VTGTDLPLGSEVHLLLTSADWDAGRVEFVLA